MNTAETVTTIICTTIVLITLIITIAVYKAS